jgi:site-specific recombinase XerD
MRAIVAEAKGQWKVLFATFAGTGLRAGEVLKDNVRRKLQAILKKVGLKRGGLHAFRHGRVSVLQENGVPVDLVKECIGHSSLRTTSRYTHFKDDYRQQIAEKIGVALRYSWFQIWSQFRPS